MSIKKVSLGLLIFSVILSACKTKQHINREVEIDSITSRISNMITDEYFSLEFIYPFNKLNLVDKSRDTLPDGLEELQSKNKLDRYKDGLANLPIIPGSIVKLTHNKVNYLNVNQTSSNFKTEKKNKTNEYNNKNDRQIVIIIIVLAFFICLSVRYAKKVRERFGC